MKLKLLLVPCDYRNPNTREPIGGPRTPPLSIATLTAHLRGQWFKVDQDDLEIKVTAHNESVGPRIDLSKFSDEGRIRRFFETGQDEDLVSLGERILQLTCTRGYDVVGLSLMNADNPSPPAVAAVIGKLIRERYGSTVLVGGHMDADTEKLLLSSGCADFGLSGDSQTAVGEINLLEFCQSYEAGTDLRQVSGVRYVKSGRLIEKSREYSPQGKYQITTPTFVGLPLDPYRRKLEVKVGNEIHHFQDLILPYFFMRGCPYECAFCNLSRAPLLNIKDPEEVASELKEMSREYRTRHFFFHNPLINPTFRFADAFAREIIRQDVSIRWTDCASVAGMNRDLLANLKEAGAVRLVFGFESASSRILRFINKPFTVERGSEVIRTAHERGIWTELELICGFPSERDADTAATVDFLEKNQQHIMACILHKFWMDGLIKDSPARYGIRYAKRKDLKTDWLTFEWEEVGGLGYRARVEQTNRAYEQIRAVVENLFVRTPGVHELFVYCEDRRRWDILKEEVRFRQALRACQQG